MAKRLKKRIYKEPTPYKIIDSYENASKRMYSDILLTMATSLEKKLKKISGS